MPERECSNLVIKLKPWWLSWAWWARGATITIYPCIYATQIPLSAVTLGHELVHFAQQKAAPSRVLWFLKYIFFCSFRRQVELEAFTSTIRYYVSRNQFTLVVKTWLIAELSGWTYLKMMSSSEAKKWVEEIASRIRKEADNGD